MGTRSVSTGPVRTSSTGNPILGFVGIGAVGISIWALYSAAGVTLSAVSQTLSAVFGEANPAIVDSLILSGIAGAFAGVAVAALRSLTRKPNRLAESFVSALFSGGLAAPARDRVFWGRVFLGGGIGFAIGAMNGASGILSFLHPFSDSAAAVLQNQAFPIVVLLGGGFGGPGGTGFGGLLFLILVVILAAILVGVFAGPLLNAIIYAAAKATGGMAKGASKAYVIRILRGHDGQSKDGKDHPIAMGVFNGFVTGFIVGLLEAPFMVWGAVTFFVSQPK